MRFIDNFRVVFRRFQEVWKWSIDLKYVNILMVLLTLKLHENIHVNLKRVSDQKGHVCASWLDLPKTFDTFAYQLELLKL